MPVPSENENWIIDKGDEIIEEKAAKGIVCLSDWKRLVYCLWVADYSMRNAGDLKAAIELYANFKSEGLQFANKLRLDTTSGLFSSEDKEFKDNYFYLFDSICDEIRGVEK